jgi:hypothetical protein
MSFYKCYTGSGEAEREREREREADYSGAIS